MRSSLRTVLSTAVAGLLGAGLLVPATPAGAATDATSARTAACAQTIFYGVRGTGESQSAELGLGSTLYRVYRNLDALVGSVQGVGAVYPARFINYDGSIQKGVTATVTDLTELATRCGPQGTTFVIAGYSQGAEVVREALAQLDEDVLPHATVILFGDPRFSPEELFVSPTSRVELTGDFDLDGRGLNEPAFDTSRWSLYSYCHGRDVVCAGRGGFIEHVDYITVDAAGAAARAAQAYYGPQRQTQLPAPAAELNGASCDESVPTVSMDVSVEWMPNDLRATYYVYRGKEKTLINTFTVHGGVLEDNFEVATVSGEQLITVEAVGKGRGRQSPPSQIAQRYIDVPSC